MKIKAIAYKKIDAKGRMVIPKEMLKMINADENTNFIVKVIENNKKVYLKLEKEE